MPRKPFPDAVYVRCGDYAGKTSSLEKRGTIVYINSVVNEKVCRTSCSRWASVRER